MKCLHAAANINSEHPDVHEQLVKFRKYRKMLLFVRWIPANAPLVDDKPPSDVKIKSVLDATAKLVPSSSSLKSSNDDYMRKYASSGPHVRSGLKVRQLLDPSTAKQNEQELIGTLSLENVDIEFAADGLEVLRQWRSDKATKEKYLEAARAKWPEATLFKAATA